MLQSTLWFFRMNSKKLTSFIARYTRHIPDIKSYVFATALVFVFGIGISLVAWRLDQQRIQTQKSAVYKEQAAALENDINSRLVVYEEMLHGIRGLFAAQNNMVSQGQWQRYIGQYDFAQTYTGISGIGYLTYVPDSQKAAFVETERQINTPDFTINPEGQRAEYAPVTYSYLADQAASGANTGFDVLADSVRKNLANRARDTGKAQVSERITLLRDQGTENNASFMMYVANYGDKKPTTVEERQASLTGYAYAGFRSHEFFDEVLRFAQPNTYQAMQVYDGTTEDPAHLLYASADFNNYDKSTWTESFKVPAFDRTWSIRLAGGPIATKTDNNRPSLILGSGIALSAAIAGLLFLIMLTRARAIVYAKREEAQQAKDDLLSLASHQLRTPATAVKQYLGMMLEGYTGEISKRQLPALQKAYGSNERQLDTINQILYVAKADAGRLSIHPHRFDLNLLVDDIAHDVSDVLESKDQELVIERSKHTLKVVADESCIRMIIENLISNASKYSHEHKIITVKTGRDNSYAWVRVMDQGVGIDAKDFGKLFKKFSRIDNDLSLQVDGSGIGLYIDKVLIELHGGRIEVSSKLGKGSTFTIYLPIKHASNFTDGAEPMGND